LDWSSRPAKKNPAEARLGEESTRGTVSINKP
jgi:hypothetical protein